MPIRRRLLMVGGSRAIAIPPSWIKNYEEKLGHPIDELNMEINDIIKISVPGNSGRKEQVETPN